MLHVQSFAVGPLQANCHLVSDADTGRAFVVDPGGDVDILLEAIQRSSLVLEAIWLTHAHIDHIGGLAELADKYPEIEVRIHAAEQAWLREPRYNLAASIGLPFRPYAGDVDVWADEDVARALDRDWRVVHVPGHSPGQCAIICDDEKLAATGDLLFDGSIGRVDLPGSDPAAMERSLRRFLEEADDLRCLVGHGDALLLGEQKRVNPFLLELR